MSVIAVLGIAAFCAGAVYCEHWLIHREARRRGRERRRRWVLGDVTAWPAARDVEGTRPLVTALERAVFAADVAWSYRARFEGPLRRCESPFELRRGRMEAQVDRCCLELGRALTSARDWLADPGRVHDPRRRYAIERLVASLQAWPLGDEPGRRDASVRAHPDPLLPQLELTIDVLESALVSLSPRHSARGVEHPFRNA